MPPKRKSYRLFAFLGLPLVIPLFLFTALLLWWTYAKSVSLLNTELTQRFEQRHIIVSTLFSAELERISQMLTSKARSPDFIHNLERLNKNAVDESLTKMQSALHGDTLDVLLVLLPDGSVLSDNSASFYSIPHSLFLNSSKTGAEFLGRNICIVDDLALLLATQQIVSPVSGKLLGYIVGALVLNDHITLLSTVNSRTHSQASAFYYGGKLMGATIADGPPELLATITSNLPATPYSHGIVTKEIGSGLAVGYIPLQILDRPTPLVMALCTRTSTLTGVRQTYMATIAGLLFFFALFLVYALMLIRYTTYPALQRLLNYAETIRKGEHGASYHSGLVTEFNTLGASLEDMVKQLRQSRMLMRNIVDSMPSVLITIDPQGNVIQWNKQAEKVTGISKKHATGKQLHAVFPRIANELEDMHNAYDAEPASYSRALTFTESGEKRHERMTIFPLTGEDVHGAVILVNDVTEHVRLEELLIQNEKMSSVGGLAAGMAHEINNPLAAILGYAQNLRKRLFTEIQGNMDAAEESKTSLAAIQHYMDLRGVPRMVDGILASGNRAANIVSNMLSFSRKSDKRFANYQMAELLDKALELAASDYNLNTEYDFKKIQIIKEYADDIPPVLCEGSEIQQVLLNLLKNGAEAMSEKQYTEHSPCFTLRVYTDGEQVVIEVEDNGPGISEAIRKRIFEPFYTTKDVGKGTGLGLSVSYFIITEQHEGAMEVQTCPDSWTRFIIRLPITPPPRKGTSLPVA